MDPELTSGSRSLGYKKAPPRRGSNCQLELSNCVLKTLTSLESRNVHSWDLDLLRRVAWVNTRASSSLADAEGTETSDGYVLSFLKLLSDGVKNSFQSITSYSLANTGS